MAERLDPLKYQAYRLLGHLPGRIGASFETRWHWVRRRRDSASAQARFDACLAGLDAGSVCLDLGANIGDVTARLAERAGHVHAWEPDPWAFARLQERLGGLANVTLHDAAVGAADGELLLRRDPRFDTDPARRSQGSSAFASTFWDGPAGDTVAVPQVDVRRILRGLGGPVALMKIDIEGSEVEVLEALLDAPELAQLQDVFVETHELQMPALRPRLAVLRRRAARLARPSICMDWH